MNNISSISLPPSYIKIAIQLIHQFKLPELKNICRKCGIRMNGNKTNITRRLESHIMKNGKNQSIVREILEVAKNSDSYKVNLVEAELLARKENVISFSNNNQCAKSNLMLIRKHEPKNFKCERTDVPLKGCICKGAISYSISALFGDNGSVRNTRSSIDQNRENINTQIKNRQSISTYKIQCDSCKTDFHLGCLGLDYRDDLPINFRCPMCISRSIDSKVHVIQTLSQVPLRNKSKQSFHIELSDETWNRLSRKTNLDKESPSFTSESKESLEIEDDYPNIFQLRVICVDLNSRQMIHAWPETASLLVNGYSIPLRGRNQKKKQMNDDEEEGAGSARITRGSGIEIGEAASSESEDQDSQAMRGSIRERRINNNNDIKTHQQRSVLAPISSSKTMISSVLTRSLAKKRPSSYTLLSTTSTRASRRTRTNASSSTNSSCWGSDLSHRSNEHQITDSNNNNDINNKEEEEDESIASNEATAIAIIRTPNTTVTNKSTPRTCTAHSNDVRGGRPSQDPEAIHICNLAKGRNVFIIHNRVPSTLPYFVLFQLVSSPATTTTTTTRPPIRASNDTDTNYTTSKTSSTVCDGTIKLDSLNSVEMNSINDEIYSTTTTSNGDKVHENNIIREITNHPPNIVSIPSPPILPSASISYQNNDNNYDSNSHTIDATGNGYGSYYGTYSSGRGRSMSYEEDIVGSDIVVTSRSRGNHLRTRRSKTHPSPVVFGTTDFQSPVSSNYNNKIAIDNNHNNTDNNHNSIDDVNTNTNNDNIGFLCSTPPLPLPIQEFVIDPAPIVLAPTTTTTTTSSSSITSESSDLLTYYYKENYLKRIDADKEHVFVNLDDITNLDFSQTTATASNATSTTSTGVSSNHIITRSKRNNSLTLNNIPIIKPVNSFSQKLSYYSDDNEIVNIMNDGSGSTSTSSTTYILE